MCITQVEDKFLVPEFNQVLKSIRPIINEMEDPRDKRGRKYPFDYLMTLLIVSFLTNHGDCKNASAYIERHKTELSEFIPEINEYGIPSHDCFNDLLIKLPMSESAKLLEKHVEGFYESDKDRLQLGGVRKLIRHKVAPDAYLKDCTQVYDNEEVLIELLRHLTADGKALKASTDKINNGYIPYNVEFYDADAQVTVKSAHVANGKQEGEVSVVREMLRECDLKNTIITFDSLHSNKETMAAVAEAGGEGCFRIKKGNCSNLYETIKQEILDNPENAEHVEHGTFTETSGGKIMTYELYIMEDTKGVCGYFSETISQMAYLKTTTTKVFYDSEGNIEREEVTEYECCFVVTCILPLEALYQIIKQHWGIEVMHYKLDMALDEDRKTGKKGNQVFNRGALRRLALNILQHLECIIKVLKDATIKERMEYLSENCFIAVLLVIGFCEDAYRKKIRVLEKKIKAYQSIDKLVDFSKLSCVSI